MTTSRNHCIWEKGVHLQQLGEWWTYMYVWYLMLPLLCTFSHALCHCAINCVCLCNAVLFPTLFQLYLFCPSNSMSYYNIFFTDLCMIYAYYFTRVGHQMAEVTPLSNTTYLVIVEPYRLAFLFGSSPGYVERPAGLASTVHVYTKRATWGKCYVMSSIYRN